MKAIKYNFLSCEINYGTEENPDIEQVLLDKIIECKTQADFDANYLIAEKEAVGEIIVEGEFDPEPTPISDLVTWEDLDLAYTQGINSL